MRGQEKPGKKKKKVVERKKGKMKGKDPSVIEMKSTKQGKDGSEENGKKRKKREDF